MAKTNAQRPGAAPLISLGLDVSSTCVGYAVFHDLNLHSYGKYIQRGDDHGEKLWTFAVWLEDLFRRVQPDNVIVELPHGGTYHAKTFAVLTMYLAQVLATHHKVKGIELPESNRLYPKTVKAQLKVEQTGNHDLNKAVMVERINQMFQLTLKCNPRDHTKATTDDDIADAIALTVAWLLKRGIDDGRYDPNPNRAGKRARKAAKGRA